MTLFTDAIFLTDEVEGFRKCREERSTSTATMTVIYCQKGYMNLYYRGKVMCVEAGEMFVRVPDFNYSLGPYALSTDVEFKQITVDADIYEKVMFEHMRIEPNWYAKQEYVKEHPIYKLNEPSSAFFNVYFQMLMLQLTDKQTAYRKRILMLVAKSAAMEMLNYLDKLAVVETDPQRRTISAGDYIFREFTRLLQHNPHKREVQWYASQLDITPKYLSEICKDRSGKAAGEWIAEVTVAELKHYLQDTTLPIREVAAIMEFPNASFFCQYTKKHTGQTPNQFRKEK